MAFVAMTITLHRLLPETRELKLTLTGASCPLRGDPLRDHRNVVQQGSTSGER